EELRLINIFENALSSGLQATKFVPASGAASRMFKDLFDFLKKAAQGKDVDMLIEANPSLTHFFDGMQKFAFWEEWKKKVQDPHNKVDWVNALLDENGLGYGSLPKGLILFHKYSDTARTAFEEHLVEAASYCTGLNGFSKVHFTVSPEHQSAFEDLLGRVRNTYQKRMGVQFDVSFSHQHKSTDTLAVDPSNEPFRDDRGRLIFRPGGHGALLENLNEMDADIIFIKNIDNVVPDHLKAETKRSKKVLAGLLVSLRSKIFSYIEKIDASNGNPSHELLDNIENFYGKEISLQINHTFESNEERAAFLRTLLNRPLRICGMVKNEGEPGGGPFLVLNTDETLSLQIVEKAQIDLNDPLQHEIFMHSTHFNPVDLVCCIKDYKGRVFDLKKFVNPETGFISKKSYNGKELKALELPGLWNGSMDNWNTVFIEIPSKTFNPVKTVNDLLRPEHQ
ncbi:MAG TPA: DUF4301 family protein, partial [Prolixibacteraceae bacterium]|nr:DUF4301 family protein [Prolixibacteraceae bacterium]